MLPIQLEGCNLGSRQRDLNNKINDAISNKISFSKIISQSEKTDVDRLFKIDLASKHKNVPYIIETLKCGNSLFVSRAMKSTWLFQDEYSNIINPDYLHQHIFPLMSENMIKKYLTIISVNISNETRALDFYIYCVHKNRPNIAIKFAILTSDNDKLKIIKENRSIIDRTHYKDFVGNSFILAKAYLEKEFSLYFTVFSSRYLYSISNTDYLDLLEEFSDRYSYIGVRFGLRITRDMLKKHKQRVLNKPALYSEILNLKVLHKNINFIEAKIFVRALLPKDVNEFWQYDYYSDTKGFFNLIPENDRYEFLKNIYTDKYPNEQFETHSYFCDKQLYKLMTKKERETWAMNSLKRNSELNDDVTWYRFISFSNAFPEMKKLIQKASDRDKRERILAILLETVNNSIEAETFLKYYYERHINERNTDAFLVNFIDFHNVLDFDETFWEIFNKLLYSVEVYNFNVKHNYVESLRKILLLHHILKDKPLSVDLFKFMIHSLCAYELTLTLSKLRKDDIEKIFQFLLKNYIHELNKYEFVSYTEDIKKDIRIILRNLLNIIAVFKQSPKYSPEVVLKLAKLDSKYFPDLFPAKTLTQGELLRLLKQDVSLLNQKIAEIHKYVSVYRFKLNFLFKKLRTYFYNDAAKVWSEHFLKQIPGYQNIGDTKSETVNINLSVLKTAILSIFYLSDQEKKTEFMLKFSPENGKVAHDKMDRNIMYVQEYICRFSCYSQPPIPFSITMSYLKGDYVKYCLPMFGYYSANLPLKDCMMFIEMLLDTPVSVQKHGIRLAFAKFDKENLQKLIIKVWEKTKNITLRKVLFVLLHKKVRDNEIELFDLLKKLVLDVNEDDAEDIFECMRRKELNDDIYGEFVENCWIALNKLPENKIIEYKKELIYQIKIHLKLMREDFVKSIIDEYLQKLIQTELSIQNAKSKSFIDAMLPLITKYLIFKTVTDEKLQIATLLLRTVIDSWNKTTNDVYYSREFLNNVLKYLQSNSFEGLLEDEFQNAQIVFKLILKELQHLPVYEIYTIIWDLEIVISLNNIVQVIKENDEKLQNCNLVVLKECGFKFGIEVGNIVKRFVENNIFFRTCISDIEDAVKEKMYYFLNNSHCGVDSGVFSTYIASGITELVHVDSFILAIYILPQNCPEQANEEFSDILSKIKSMDSLELKCVYYNKFCGDHKKRKYV